MVKFFVCSCLYDIARFSNYNDDIDKFNDLIEDNGLLKKDFLILKENESNYICCKDTIQFCCRYYPELYETCLDDRPHEYTDMCSVNCLDLLEYGFEVICLNCERIIFNFFLRVLIKIEK